MYIPQRYRQGKKSIYHLYLPPLGLLFTVNKPPTFTHHLQRSIDIHPRSSFLTVIYLSSLYTNCVIGSRPSMMNSRIPSQPKIQPIGSFPRYGTTPRAPTPASSVTNRERGRHRSTSRRVGVTLFCSAPDCCLLAACANHMIMECYSPNTRTLAWARHIPLTIGGG